MFTWDNQSTQTQDKNSNYEHKAVEEEKKEAGGLGGTAPQQVVDPSAGGKAKLCEAKQGLFGSTGLTTCCVIQRCYDEPLIEQTEMA